MQFSRKQWYSLLIALTISMVLVWALLSGIENREIIRSLQGVSPKLLLLAFGIYILIYISRALRFNRLLKAPLQIKEMFTIMCLHNAVNVALPARSGELSYPYLLKRKGIPYAESLSSLIAARLFDLIAIFILFLAALPFLGTVPDFAVRVQYGFLGALALLFLGLGIAVLWKLQIKYWLETLRRWTRTDRLSLLTRFQRLGGNIVDALKQYANRRMLGQLIIHSVVQWFLMFLFSYVVLRALGMELTLAQSFIGSSLSMLVLVIPFQGVLGFGTTEAVWVLMFMALGFQSAALIPLSFAAHIIALLCTGIMGIYGVTRMQAFTRAQSAQHSRRSG